MLRRIVAPAGATLPIGGLLAVVAPESVADGEIDVFRRRLCAARTRRRSGNRFRGCWSARIEAGGKRLRYLEMGAGEGLPWC